MGFISFFKQAWYSTLLDKFRKELEDCKRQGVTENEACGALILRRWNLPCNPALINQATYLAGNLGESDRVLAMFVIGKSIGVEQQVRAEFVCDPFFPRFGVLYRTALPFLEFSTRALADFDWNGLSTPRARELPDAASAAHFVTLIAPFEPGGWSALAHFKALGVDRFNRFEEVGELIDRGLSKAEAFLKRLPREEVVLRCEIQHKIDQLRLRSGHLVEIQIRSAGLGYV